MSGAEKQQHFPFVGLLTVLREVEFDPLRRLAALRAAALVKPQRKHSDPMSHAWLQEYCSTNTQFSTEREDRSATATCSNNKRRWEGEHTTKNKSHIKQQQKRADAWRLPHKLVGFFLWIWLFCLDSR